MIVYLARDIPAFVMYCVNGESGSSLLIESTDSMIIQILKMINIAIRCREELGWLSVIYNTVFQTLLFVFELWLKLSVVESFFQ